MTAVEVNHLIKSFSGKTAVNDLSFSVVPGEIVGLIGPNGAGKSTTIKTILDFIKPDSGEVTLFGDTLNEANKNHLGYLPEERGLYKKLAAIDLIIYLASLKGMDRRSAGKSANELLHQTGMLSNKKMKIEEMSKGMGQMIQWIVTIIHDPKLIILDESFSGLDPVNTDLLKRTLGNLRDRGKAIILSTHQMNEVEELCDRILMINNGCAVLYGNLKEIKSSYRNHSVLVDIEGELGELPGVIEKRPHKGFVELVLDRDTTPQQVLEKLFNRGLTVNRFEMATLSLNEIFLKMVGKKDE
ncbi:MAG: ATP-binding cassette domain-containing protein [Thermodesulfobacteriota bacterium]|jgi:ABC-2 type transport system ATP-binding protein